MPILTFVHHFWHLLLSCHHWAVFTDHLLLISAHLLARLCLVRVSAGDWELSRRRLVVTDSVLNSLCGLLC